MGKITEVVNRYYDAWNYKQGNGLDELIADEIEYHGPLEQRTGADQVLAMAAKYAPLHGGMNMIRQFEDGDEVCSIYDLVIKTPEGSLSIPTADWILVKNGRVARQRVFQDVREVVERFAKR